MLTSAKYDQGRLKKQLLGTGYRPSYCKNVLYGRLKIDSGPVFP